MENEPRSARAEFRAKLAAFAEEHPELPTRDTADQFGASVMLEEPSLVRDFVSAEARNILTWELRAQFSRTRHGVFAALDITNPDHVPVATLPEDRRETLYERITQLREFVPSENRVRRLGELTKPMLREAAQFNASRLAKYGWNMMLDNQLADGLSDNVTTVDQHYTPGQIAVLGEQISKEMSRGNFRLKVQPVRSLPRTPAVSEQADGGHPERPEIDRRLVAG